MKTKPKPKAAKTKTKAAKNKDDQRGKHGHHNTKWDPMMLVHIYRYARAGMPNTQILEALKVCQRTWDNWTNSRRGNQVRRKMIYDTLALARQTEGNTFRDFCYQRLAPELQQLWDQIVQTYESGTGIAQMELILGDRGESIRQHLYLHALVYCNFSPSLAMSMVGVKKSQVDKWVKESVQFAELTEEIMWHKKNFFDERLVNLVALGDTSATIFVNKTINKDRGYGDVKKLEIEHSGEVQHLVLDLNELMSYMTERTKEDILDAMRKHEDAKRLARFKDNQTSPQAGQTMEQILEQQVINLPATAETELVGVAP